MSKIVNLNSREIVIKDRVNINSGEIVVKDRVNSGEIVVKDGVNIPSRGCGRQVETTALYSQEISNLRNMITKATNVSECLHSVEKEYRRYNRPRNRDIWRRTIAHAI